jgi:hypothetical protein
MVGSNNVGTSAIFKLFQVRLTLLEKANQTTK